MLLIRKGKEGNAMLSTELFIVIVGLCARFYTIGYAHGQRGAKTKRQRIHIGLSLILAKE